MSQKRILIVDDERDIGELVGCNLLREGFLVDLARSGEEALGIIRKNPPDLIVLDLTLSGISGFELLKKLKRDEKQAAIPVIILSVKGDEIDVITGLELGAADYVSKPFSPRILVARVKSVLRRQSSEGPEVPPILHVGGIRIDSLQREVLVDQNPVPLTCTEFDLLRLLVRRPGRVYSRTEIIDGTKGESYPATDRSVDVQIVGLRRKLGHWGERIKTVRGVGYKFEESHD